jgi:membrane protein YdbS with pleckstrin-like domain
MAYVLAMPIMRMIPLTTRRRRYRRFLQKDSLETTAGIVSRSQLVARIMQIQKVINHPKGILLSLDHQRALDR